MAETYGLARGNLRKAEDTSALDTEVENDEKTKRRRRKIAYDVEDAATSDDADEHPKRPRTPASSTPLPDIPVSLQHSSGISLSLVPGSDHVVFLCN